MTADSGLIHAEEPLGSETVNSLQLWVNLPRAQKMTRPRYQDLSGERIPVRREPGALVRVFSGSSGDVTASTLNHTPVTVLEIVLDGGASVVQELPGGYNGFLYVLEGKGYFGADATPGVQGQVLWLGSAGQAPHSRISARAEQWLRAFLFAGQPVREPVVAHGPFVMNTEEEIREAFADYRAARFGTR